MPRQPHDHPVDYQMPEGYNPGGAYPPNADVDKHPKVEPEKRAGHFPFRGTEQHGVAHTTEQPDQLQDARIDTVPQRTRPTGADHDPLAVKIKADKTPTTERRLRTYVVMVPLGSWVTLVPKNPRRKQVIIANDPAPAIANGAIVLSERMGSINAFPNLPVSSVLPGSRTLPAMAFTNALYATAQQTDNLPITIYEETEVDI